MVKSYAKSGKEDGKRNSSPRRGRLGGAQEQSSCAGNEVSDGAIEGDSAWLHRSPEDFIDRGETNLGKVLSQLRELQHSHLVYVQSHEERLRLRLEAAQQHHQDILKKMKELEQEILCLLGETVS